MNNLQVLLYQTDSCRPPPSPVADSITVSSSKSAVWVNSLWFLSLLISLTCATLATFIQKWARRYSRVKRSTSYNPHKGARLREFPFDGVDKWHISWAVEALPVLLYLSLFLFFIGLAICLVSINPLIFGTVVWWAVLSVMAYLYITLLPSALFKVLSSPVISRFRFNAACGFRRWKNYHHKRCFKDTKKTAEEPARKQASEINVLLSTFDALDEAWAQEEFFLAIPGFFKSELANGLEEHITDNSPSRLKFSEALNRFLDRTLALSSVSESVKNRRVIICLNAAHAALGFKGVSQILQDILSGRWHELIQSVEMGHSFRRWGTNNHERLTPIVRRIVAQIVVGVRERDDRWISLVNAEYGVAEHVLRDNIGHDNSVLLSILIHMIRQAFHTRSWTPRVLSSLSDFSIRDTSPELQRDFCALWNEIVLKVRNEGPINIPVRILREVRHAYIALHQGIEAALTEALTMLSTSTHDFDIVLVEPRSYLLCNIPSHQRRSTTDTPATSSLIIPSPMDSDHTPDGSGTASQQGGEAYVIVEPPLSTDYNR